jgi:hypothetical protein
MNPPIPTQTPPAPPPFVPMVEETPPVPTTEIPAMVTAPPSKPHMSGGKIFASVLGLLLLVGGVGAGVFLTSQNQDVRNRAAENSPSASPTSVPTTSPSPSSTAIPKFFKESNTLKFNRAGTVVVHTTRKVELTLTPVGTTLGNKKLVQTFDHTGTETFQVNAGDSYTIGAKFFNSSGKQASALGWRQPYNPTTCGNVATGHKVDIGALVSSIQASSSLNLTNPDVLPYPVQCWADAPNSRWNEDKHTGDDAAFSDTYDFNDARIIFTYDTGGPTTAPLCSSNVIERNQNNTWTEVQGKDLNIGDTVRFIAIVTNPVTTTKVQIRVSLNDSVVKDWTEATASSTSGEYYIEYPITQVGSYSVEQRIE